MNFRVTQAEIEALQASDLPRDTPLVLRKVSHSYFSTARLCGGCKIGGKYYTYVPTTDELIREDVVKFLAKLRRKPKKPKQAAKKPTLQATLFDDDATFPSTERDNYLCGLVCELVQAEPGLPISAYVDSLVIALGYDRHKRLLSVKDRTQFAKLCKASPLASWTAADKIPWAELQNVLTRRKAIVPDDQTIQAGSELAAVRHSYPAVASELVALLRKAAAELRDLQSQASRH